MTEPMEDGRMDAKELGALITKSEAMCRSIVNAELEMRFLCREDGEDLMQAARLAVVEAAKKFEARGGAQFTTFAWVVIKSRVKSAARSIKRHVGLAEDEDGLIYEPAAEGAEEEPERVATRHELDKLLGLLNEDERKPLDLMLKGLSYSEIAKQLGLEGRNLRGMALHRIRKMVELIWARKENRLPEAG